VLQREASRRAREKGRRLKGGGGEGARGASTVERAIDPCVIELNIFGSCQAEARPRVNRLNYINNLNENSQQKQSYTAATLGNLPWKQLFPPPH